MAAPAFLNGEAKRGAKTLLGGKSIWLSITHFHNAGQIVLLYSKSPSPFLFPLISLFSLLLNGSFPFHLSFIHISRPSRLLILLWVWGSAVSSPSGSGQSPAAKCNLVNSGRSFSNMSKRQTIQCSLNYVIYFFIQ